MGRPLTSRHVLLTNSWTADVATMESAIERFPADRPLTSACQVVFFELTADDDLHVNVTHQRETRHVGGWSGPARVADGFVNNRRFKNASPDRILGHIRSMVFARTP